MNSDKGAEMEEHIYGNPTLGMASRFLREVLGNDVLFDISKQFHSVDKDSFRKQLIPVSLQAQKNFSILGNSIIKG